MSTPSHSRAPFHVAQIPHPDGRTFGLITVIYSAEQIRLATLEQWHGDAEEMANAYLFKAAPKLLQACKASLAALSQPATFPADISAAKQWLANAIAETVPQGIESKAPDEQSARQHAAKSLLQGEGDLLSACFLALVQLRDGNMCVWQLQPLIERCASALYARIQPGERAGQPHASPYDNDTPREETKP